MMRVVEINVYYTVYNHRDIRVLRYRAIKMDAQRVAIRATLQDAQVDVVPYWLTGIAIQLALDESQITIGALDPECFAARSTCAPKYEDVLESGELIVRGKIVIRSA